eukprot:IDg10330t1
MVNYAPAHVIQIQEPTRDTSTPVLAKLRRHIASTTTISPAFSGKLTSITLYPTIHQGAMPITEKQDTQSTAESAAKRPMLSPSSRLNKSVDSQAVKIQPRTQDNSRKHTSALASPGLGLKKMKMKKVSTSKSATLTNIGKGKHARKAKRSEYFKQSDSNKKSKIKSLAEAMTKKKTLCLFDTKPSYQWTLIQKPDCSEKDDACINGSLAPQSSFVPDVPGLYVFALSTHAQGNVFLETCKVHAVAHGESHNFATDSTFVYKMAHLLVEDPAT